MIFSGKVITFKSSMVTEIAKKNAIYRERDWNLLTVMEGMGGYNGYLNTRRW